MTLEITELAALRAQIADWRAGGARIALVPTMGALHRGHLALVEAARAQADRVVVSIFVNPTQFGPNEDFTRYPRPLAEDMAQLRAVGADAAWLPDVATIYPQGFSSSIRITGVSDHWEGAHRPGHFDGVATVVAKLFQQVQPDIACFGEKDYQQLQLIERLAKDLDIPVAVHGLPTIREADGLALSSRNRYLSSEERAVAVQLHATLQAARQSLLSGLDAAAVLGEATAHLLKSGFRAVDYFGLCHAHSLTPLTRYEAPARLLAAAWLGTTRLIDNIPME